MQHLLCKTCKYILLCNDCKISAQNIIVEADFTLMLLWYFIPRKGGIIYFSTQTMADVCYWKSICTFLGSYLLSEMEALQLFSSFICCQWAAVTVTIRGSPRSQAGPLGAQWACFVLPLNLCVGVGDYSKHFLLSFLLIACIPLKKQAMKALWLRHSDTVKLMYSIEQRGWWRNNDFSGGARLPSVLL